jgi:hypothetical protein
VALSVIFDFGSCGHGFFGIFILFWVTRSVGMVLLTVLHLTLEAAFALCPVYLSACHMGLFSSKCWSNFVRIIGYMVRLMKSGGDIRRMQHLRLCLVPKIAILPNMVGSQICPRVSVGVNKDNLNRFPVCLFVCLSSFAKHVVLIITWEFSESIGGEIQIHMFVVSDLLSTLVAYDKDTVARSWQRCFADPRLMDSNSLCE